jgi:hypothetical protein
MECLNPYVGDGVSRISTSALASNGRNTSLMAFITAAAAARSVVGILVCAHARFHLVKPESPTTRNDASTYPMILCA